MTSKVVIEKIQITNKLGLHARAAAKFVKITSKLNSKITVSNSGITVNGSSILGLMTLAASKGTEIVIKCTGDNAFKDIEVVLKLIRNNFGEEKPITKKVVKEKIYSGIGVSPGFAIGVCSVFESVGLNTQMYSIPQKKIEQELNRFDKAVKLSIKDLRKLIQKSSSKKISGENEIGLILEAHISMLKSSSLVNEARKRISKNLINAEYAISEELKKHDLAFKKIKNKYFKERFNDVSEVCRRLIDSLQKKKKKNIKINKIENRIIVSDELSAADLIAFQKRSILGLVSVLGGPEGHFSIVARSLSIPTVVGVKDFLKDIENGEKMIVDGNKGLIITNPNISTIRKYDNKIDDMRNESLKLDNYKKAKPITKDFSEIFVEANVDNSDEVRDAMEKGVSGIGLFRSEYLYMNKKKIPSELEQFNLIKKSLDLLDKKTLTVRTLDIGNDKHTDYLDELVGPSPNPALGLRAIRLTLAFPKIFERQISAILKANYYGSLRIMLPMVSNLDELKAAKNIIKTVYKTLKTKRAKVAKTLPPIGVLIETPAAALIADSLAEHCDFFAIGSNDLTMYTLAIDRGDENVANIYDPAHLSVLKLIKMSNDSGKSAKIPVSICGEMAGDLIFTPLLIGMGINTLSMSTSRILKVKQYINSIKFSDAKRLTRKIFLEKNDKKIKQLLIDFRDSIKL